MSDGALISSFMVGEEHFVMQTLTNHLMLSVKMATKNKIPHITWKDTRQLNQNKLDDGDQVFAVECCTNLTENKCNPEYFGFL